MFTIVCSCGAKLELPKETSPGSDAYENVEIEMYITVYETLEIKCKSCGYARE